MESRELLSVAGLDSGLQSLGYSIDESPVVIESRISAGSDDAEETSSGGMRLTSTDLELVYDGSNQHVGMRFNDLNIPRGATITNAYIQFQVDETSKNSTSLTFRGEDTDNAATFNSSAYNISSRPTTDASVGWNPAAWNVVGEAGAGQRTSNLAPIVQEIVDRGGWSVGNSLVVIATGSGERTAESYNGDSDGAALLHVEYTATSTTPPDGGTGSKTVESRVDASSDDAEERSSGDMYRNSSDLEMVYDKGDQTVGMRFNDLNIPQGATITNAYLQFQADETHSKDTRLTIRGEDTDHAATFGTSDRDISSRPTTSASVAWTPAAWASRGEAGPDQRTPDLSAIVQEIVDRPGWSASSSLVMIVTGSGERVAESYDGDSDGAPLLHVEYTVGETPDPSNESPNAADDTAAVAEDGLLTIDVLANDRDADDDVLSVIDIDTSGTKGGVTLRSDGSIGYDPNGRFDSLAAGQTAVDTFTYTVGDGKGGLDTAMVTVTVTGVDDSLPPTRGTIEVRVSSSSDDAEEKASGSMYLNSSDLEMTYNRGDQAVGLRFNGLHIPRGATITNAWIQFQADETGSTTTSLTIRGDDTDNASTFTSSDGNIRSRPATSAAVSWIPSTWTSVGDAGLDQRTPNIASIIQEIVDRSGWADGNSLVITLDGTGERTADSYDGDSGGAPLLHVEYSTDGSTEPMNQAPWTDAGSDRTVDLPANVVLDATVTDDGLPGGSVVTTWTKVSGPGSVRFDDASAIDATADFSEPGVYVLRLTADDGQLTASDDVTIAVFGAEPINLPPTVEAGASQTVILPGSALLDATVTDDGLPGGSVVTTWAKVSGPGSVSFADAGATDTTVTFTETGVYVLRLTAGDGSLTAEDEVTINVQEAPTTDELLAFPGAEGFGAQSVGGRGGRVIEVTNLNDSGSGSLRAALEASGPRIVVFRVGGTITLDSRIEVTDPYLTVAGHTAPGDGIALRNGSSNTKGPLWIETHDVVIRHLRVRPGPGGDTDGITLAYGSAYNIMLDHTSVSWAVDENFSSWKAVNNVTIQWSILSEALYDSTHSEGSHSMGALLGSDGSHSFTVHHNLMAHNAERNPRIQADLVDVVNNVIYNPKFSGGWAPSHATDGFGSVRVNYVGNYYKAGPESGSADYLASADGDVKIYVEGNITPKRPSNDMDEADGVVRSGDQGKVVSSRHDAPQVTTTSAFQAYEDVLAYAGASMGIDELGNFYFRRDSVDTRIVNETRNGTGGIIDDPSEVGGWPKLASGEAPADSDHDGMPDAWELLYGFDPENADNGPRDADGDGYTNVEEYLNGTMPVPVNAVSYTSSNVMTVSDDSSVMTAAADYSMYASSTTDDDKGVTASTVDSALTYGDESSVEVDLLASSGGEEAIDSLLGETVDSIDDAEPQADLVDLALASDDLLGDDLDVLPFLV